MGSDLNDTNLFKPPEHDPGGVVQSGIYRYNMEVIEKNFKPENSVMSSWATVLDIDIGEIGTV